jgi:hypothetical protein
MDELQKFWRNVRLFDELCRARSRRAFQILIRHRASQMFEDLTAEFFGVCWPRENVARPPPPSTKPAC